MYRGLTFPEIPPELSGLTVIEQRLVSPRHEFMNIRSLGRERQHGLHEMVVNVPIDIDKTVSQLPRTFLQSQTIHLQLFRKLSFAKPYLYETIRPNVVLEAARYLSTTEIFKLEKVVVSEDWVNSVTRTGSSNVKFIVNPNDEPCDIVIHCLAKSIRTPIIILQTVRVPSNILTFVGASTKLYI